MPLFVLIWPLLLAVLGKVGAAAGAAGGALAKAGAAAGGALKGLLGSGGGAGGVAAKGAATQALPALQAQAATPAISVPQAPPVTAAPPPQGGGLLGMGGGKPPDAAAQLPKGPPPPTDSGGTITLPPTGGPGQPPIGGIGNDATPTGGGTLNARHDMGPPPGQKPGFDWQMGAKSLFGDAWNASPPGQFVNALSDTKAAWQNPNFSGGRKAFETARPMLKFGLEQAMGGGGAPPPQGQAGPSREEMEEMIRYQSEARGDSLNGPSPVPDWRRRLEEMQRQRLGPAGY